MAVHPLDFDLEIKFDDRIISASHLEGHSVDVLARRCTVTANKGRIVEIFYRKHEGIETAGYKFENSRTYTTNLCRADYATDLLEEIAKNSP